MVTVLRADDLRYLKRILTNVALPALRLGDDADDPAIKDAADRCERLALSLAEAADGMCSDDGIVVRDGVTAFEHGV